MWRQKPETVGWGWCPLPSGEPWPGLSWFPSTLRILYECKGLFPAAQSRQSSYPHPLWPQTRLMIVPRASWTWRNWKMSSQYYLS